MSFSFRNIPLNYTPSYSLQKIGDVYYNTEENDTVEDLKETMQIPSNLLAILTSKEGVESGITNEWIVRAFNSDPRGLSVLRQAEETIMKNREITAVAKLGFKLYNTSSFTLDQLILYRRSAELRKYLFRVIKDSGLDEGLFVSLSNGQIENMLDDMGVRLDEAESPPKLATAGSKIPSEILSSILSMTGKSISSIALINKSMKQGVETARIQPIFWKGRVAQTLDRKIDSMNDNVNWEKIDSKLKLYSLSPDGILNAAIRAKDIDVLSLIINKERVSDDSLSLAVDTGNINIVRMIIEFGYSDVVWRESIDRSVSDNYPEILTLLLSVYTWKTGEWDNSKLIEVAIENNYVLIVKILLGNSGIMIQSPKVEAALIINIKNGYSDILQLILSNPYIPISNMKLYEPAIESDNIIAFEMLFRDARIDPTGDDHKIVKMIIKSNRFNMMELILSDQRIDPDRLLLDTVKSGYIDIVRLILNDVRTGMQDSNNSLVIMSACLPDKYEILKILIESGKVTPGAKNNMLLRELVDLDGYNQDILLYLLSLRGVNPADSNNDIIRMAVMYNNIEAVRILMMDPRVNPSDNKDYALSLSINNGNMEMVQLLLGDSRVDPTNGLASAIRNRREAVMRLLISDPRVKLNITHAMGVERNGWNDIGRQIRNKIAVKK